MIYKFFAWSFGTNVIAMITTEPKYAFTIYVFRINSESKNENFLQGLKFDENLKQFF